VEARKKRNIKSGEQYSRLFPDANAATHTIMTNAGVSDTVAFIPKVVRKTLHHTKAIAKVLKGNNKYDTCRNIWQFVYDHIAYRRDKDGYEQIRSPARSWHDRQAGVDCDCYTTFISSILTNLGIAHQLRITKYSKPYFQHIYPIANCNGRNVILDCVTDQFDFEVPYSEKKDYPMDLQYLDGLDDIGYNDNRLFDGTGEMEELGKLFKKKASAPASGGGNKKGGGVFKKIGTAAKKVTKAAGSAVKNTGKKIATTAKKANLKKVLNVVNKVNPATVALRNGLLAGMKLNVSNVAKRLRWSYLTPDQAKAKGMQMDRWNKLVQTRQKLENIFYGAGGNPANLKKAILGGKGNSDKAVNGFDGFDGLRNRSDAAQMSVHTSLSQLLGPEIYYSENGYQSLGELGEPVTLAVVAAASGAIATIAGLIKKIGDIFGGKGEGSKDFNEAENAVAEKETQAITQQASEAGVSPAETFTPASPSATNEGGGGSPGSTTTPSTSYDNPMPSDSGGGATKAVSPAAQTSTEIAEGEEKIAAKAATDTGAGANEEGFWNKHKKWLLPVGIGIGGLTIIAIAASAMKSKSNTPVPAKAKPMHGLPSRKNHQRNKGKKQGKKKSVKLL